MLTTAGGECCVVFVCGYTQKPHSQPWVQTCWRPGGSAVVEWPVERPTRCQTAWKGSSAPRGMLGVVVTVGNHLERAFEHS